MHDVHARSCRQSVHRPNDRPTDQYQSHTSCQCQLVETSMHIHIARLNARQMSSIHIEHMAQPLTKVNTVMPQWRSIANRDITATWDVKRLQTWAQASSAFHGLQWNSVTMYTNTNSKSYNWLNRAITDDVEPSGRSTMCTTRSTSLPSHSGLTTTHGVLIPNTHRVHRAWAASSPLCVCLSVCLPVGLSAA